MSEGVQDGIWNSWTLYDTAEDSHCKSHKEKDIPGQESSIRETRVFNAMGVVYIRKDGYFLKDIFLLGKELWTQGEGQAVELTHW